MKIKKFAAAALAALMVMSMAACGNTKDSGSDNKAAENTTTAAAAEGAESKAEEDKPAETEKGWKDGVFTSDLYSMDVDESIWKETSQAGVDSMFQYNGESSDPLDASASFNVVAMSDSSIKGFTPEDYAEQIEKVYSSMDGFSAKDKGTAKLGDEDVFSITLGYNMGEATMTINLLIYSDDDKLIAFTYGAIDSVMDKMQPEFDKVIKSFKVKK